MSTRKILLRSVWSIALASAFCSQAHALSVSRLTPPSVLFASAGGESSPVIARFVPGQRFDLQATVHPMQARRLAAPNSSSMAHPSAS